LCNFTPTESNIPGHKLRINQIIEVIGGIKARNVAYSIEYQKKILLLQDSEK
jgi:hypothetical protein